jgi:hypothetical protein
MLEKSPTIHAKDEKESCILIFYDLLQ